MNRKCLDMIYYLKIIGQTATKFCTYIFQNRQLSYSKKEEALEIRDHYAK